MKYLNAGNQNIKVHPELVERFQELIRHHFNAARKSKDVYEIKRTMREVDLKEQAAMLKADCVIKIEEKHEGHCSSRMGGMWYTLSCDCTPERRIVFKEEPKKPLHISPFNWWSPFMDEGSSEDEENA